MVHQNRFAFILFLCALSLSGCKQSSEDFMAAGIFEANEIVVSADIAGKIVRLAVEEGNVVEEGKLIAVLDSVQVSLQLAQAEASLHVLPQKLTSPNPQILVLNNQRNVAESQYQALKAQFQALLREQERITGLWRGGAATSQQKEEMDSKVSSMKQQLQAAEEQTRVVVAQIAAARQQAELQNRAIRSEEEPMERKVDQLRDQLLRTKIRAPKTGTILALYAREGEWVSPGKPIAKMADLSEVWLHAFVSAGQLPEITLGKQVNVWIDQGDQDKVYKGTITWISNQAEFTPKTIQTRDERANLVYKLRVKVPNDGGIKLGMYGELRTDSSKP